MKAMNRIATKIAGVALATVMAFGGAAVFAAENGEQVYNRTFTVRAERSHALLYFNYYGTGASMTVPDTGYYTISFTAFRSGDYHKELTIRNMESGTRIISAEGSWDGYTVDNVYLIAGDTYGIDVYADDFMGFNVLDKSSSADFSLTVTLESKESDEVEEEPEIEDVLNLVLPLRTPGIGEEPEIDEEPEIGEEPEEIIEIEEEPAEIVTTEEAEAEPLESIAPAAPALTIAQIRELAVRNFVGHLYTDGLGRRATESEITEWTDKLMCGSITATDAASQILTSSELNEHNFDNEQIAAILSDVFNAESERDILAKLNDGASVASVIEQLAGTDNWASKCAFYGVNV